MNSFLLYIIESTICIVTFYFLNRIFVKKDSDFSVNRILLLSLVIASLIIPIIKIPYFMQNTAPKQSVASIQNSSFDKFFLQKLPTTNFTKELATKAEDKNRETLNKTDKNIIPFKSILLFIYLSGVLISLLILIRNIVSIQLILQEAKIKRMNGYRLIIVDKEIQSFTFLKSVVISKSDYESHSSYILMHEIAHIRFNHFYDLMFLEAVKIIFWFNPVIYFLINDLKQIHEFQADKHTLQSGLDAVQYQLLMIKKCVGPKRFAFANSFNQSQIKKRITMINNPKNQKLPRWIMIAFFAMAAILIISFSSCTVATSNNAKGSEIQGTWKLVKYNYSGDTIMHMFPENRIKFIADNNFCWINISLPNNRVTDSAGGTYKLSGENYSEFIEYGGTGMTSYVNNEQKFTVKVENDKLYLAGELSSGQRIREVWERLADSPVR